jgi:hypothetical protein
MYTPEYNSRRIVGPHGAQSITDAVRLRTRELFGETKNFGHYYDVFTALWPQLFTADRTPEERLAAERLAVDIFLAIAEMDGFEVDTENFRAVGS